MDTINIKDQVIDIANKYAEILKNELDIQSVYLYGSYAKGNHTSDSDIDIAIIAKNLTGDLFEDTIKLMKYRRQVDNRIEPHPFLVSEFNVDNPLAKEIMDTGTKIL
jgi:predicted nucleotidyltransferase